MMMGIKNTIKKLLSMSCYKRLALSIQITNLHKR